MQTASAVTPFRKPYVLPPEAMLALLELWEDSPERFVLLTSRLARSTRPAHGSITIHFQAGKISFVEYHETTK